MNFEIVEITPKIAREMLTKNVCNRSFRHTWVSVLAQDMLNGNWELTPSPIIFDEDGTLIDGQHRLMAVEKSGVTCSFVVCTNAKPTFSIDNGMKRTVLDQLKMSGSALKDEHLTRPVISAVRLLFELSEGRFHQSTHEIEKFIINNIDHIDALSESVKKNNVRGVSTAPVFGAMLSALQNGMSKEIVKHFYDVLNSGYSNTPSDKMIIIHRNWLQSKTNVNGMLFRRESYLRTYKVLQLMSEGKTRLRIYAPDIKTPIYINGHGQNRIGAKP